MADHDVGGFSRSRLTSIVNAFRPTKQSAQPGRSPLRPPSAASPLPALKSKKYRKGFVKEREDTRISTMDLVTLLQMEIEKRNGLFLLVGYIVYCAAFFILCIWAYDFPQLAGQCESAIRTSYFEADFAFPGKERDIRTLHGVKTRSEVIAWLFSVWLPQTYPPVESRDGIANETARRIYLRSKSVCYL